jgi:hypothetical protein
LSHIERRIVAFIVMLAGSAAALQHGWERRLVWFAAVGAGIPAVFFALLLLIVGAGKFGQRLGLLKKPR